MNRRKKASEELLAELQKDLKKIYGQRLRKIVLYGSYARGQAGKDSDLDVAVVLKGRVNPGKEIDRMLDVLVDLNLKYQILVSAYPVSEQDFLSRPSPLLINIRSEGMAL
jgi:uncharacterized protein